MNRAEICKHIDDKANFYLRMLDNAGYMEYIDNGYYTMIRPKEGQKGRISLFDIRLEHLCTCSPCFRDELIATPKELEIKTMFC
jgi:hypothetical protein